MFLFAENSHLFCKMGRKNLLVVSTYCLLSYFVYSQKGLLGLKECPLFEPSPWGPSVMTN